MILKTTMLLCLLLCIAASSAFAQQVSAQPLRAGQPDVLILVFAMQDGQDHLVCAYPKIISHAQALRDVAALQAATGWRITGVKITDALPPIHDAKDKTTTVEFIAPHVISDQVHHFDLAPVVQAFRPYPYIILTYLVGSPSFQFEGLRRYTDNHIQISLNQQGLAYTYQILIRDSHFGSLTLPAYQATVTQTRTVQAVDRTQRKAWLVALIAVMAVGAGGFVYSVMARNA